MTKLSQKSIPYKVYQFIQKNNLIQPGQRVIVAVSGGVDSIALLDILLTLREKLSSTLRDEPSGSDSNEKINILACHFNHRLRGEESDKDEKFVQKFCAEKKVECIIGRAGNKKQYKSEEEARVARYSFFEKILKEGRGDLVATAHNLNDQAETFLLRLARGSGIFGLKSIPSQREKIIRPLLSISRSEVERYLKDRRLQYRIDSTNKNLDFDRNYIRHKILPLFEKLNPSFTNSLFSTINLVRDDSNFLSNFADKKLKEISIESQSRIEIDRKKWLCLPNPIKKMVLRRAAEKLVGLKDITSTQIEEICEICEKGVGKKHKILPRSLRVELISAKIILSI